MNIIIIGDTSGNPDEAMKKIGLNLSIYLNKINNINSSFLCIEELLINRKKYKKTDIIHYMTGPSWRSFIYLFLLKILFRCKSVISFIHPEESFKTILFFKLFTPDGVIVQSDKWLEKVKLTNCKVTDIPLVGIKEKFTAIDENKKKNIRNELQLPLDKIIVLHVGHLNKGRKLDIFKQFETLDFIYPLIIASTTVKADKDLVKELKKHKINIIHKFIPNIEKYYQAADHYIFPTIDERFCIQIPLSVIEAYACGLNIISTPFGGLPKYLTNNNRNITYTNKINNIINYIKHNKRKENLNTQIINKFNWINISNDLVNFYQKL
tara:strand:- start:275 stop:1243 length:969 start_codon:yes stop_codon:yes gene_type:complete